MSEDEPVSGKSDESRQRAISYLMTRLEHSLNESLEHSKAFFQTFVTVSGGATVLSISFVETISGTAPRMAWMLVSSWIALSASLLSILVAFGSDARQRSRYRVWMRQQLSSLSRSWNIDMFDRMWIDDSSGRGVGDTFSQLWTRAAFALLVLGLSFFLAFTAANLSTRKASAAVTSGSTKQQPSGALPQTATHAPMKP